MILGTPRSKQPFLALGKRSTFNDPDIPHPEKRYKMVRSVNSIKQSPYDDPGGKLMSDTSKIYPEETQRWEEAGSGDNSEYPCSLAELETAQLSVETGKEATLKHKTLRATDESAPAELGARLHSGITATSRSSIYVDAFNLALDTVLKDECHLFNSTERGVFDHWKSLDYEAQYLLVLSSLLSCSKLTLGQLYTTFP
jgi:Fanconi-associated nuclease 1